LPQVLFHAADEEGIMKESLRPTRAPKRERAHGKQQTHLMAKNALKHEAKMKPTPPTLSFDVQQS